MKLKQACKFILVTLVMLFISACGGLPIIEVDHQSQQKWSQYQLEAARFNRWDLYGRAVIMAKDEVYSTGLKWRRDPLGYEMMLEAPFGQGVFQLQADQNLSTPVSLHLPDGQAVLANDAEEVLERVIGWSIPVSGLEFWIRGIPQKKADLRLDLNGDGRLRSLDQGGWHISYLDYFEPDNSARGLPRKLYLKRDDLEIKIVIERWQKPDAIHVDSGLFPEFN
ncbi:MAG: lipoprotein insertase outer membrane protein LolB [Gammaproteobacteria bacterium]|nr:lipoprotein insertase outer membrane protein LolB [Gammaproteobacteria bacterium]